MEEISKFGKNNKLSKENSNLLFIVGTGRSVQKQFQIF